MKAAGNPWMKFYPADWRADPALRSCTIGARGLWVEMLCIMHEAAPYGSLLINGARVDKKRLASLAGIPERECIVLLLELEGFGVFSRDDDGTIYSRRMRRDAEKAVKDKENGKGGGNPRLKGGVNPPVIPTDNGSDKAQIPEARKKDAAPAAPDPEVELFRRGREVLGKQAGGLVAKLLAVKQKNIPLARAAIEQASTKSDPREYVARIANGPAVANQPAWIDGIEGVL